MEPLRDTGQAAGYILDKVPVSGVTFKDKQPHMLTDISFDEKILHSLTRLKKVFTSCLSHER